MTENNDGNIIGVTENYFDKINLSLPKLYTTYLYPEAYRNASKILVNQLNNWFLFSDLNITKTVTNLTAPLSEHGNLVLCKKADYSKIFEVESMPATDSNSESEEIIVSDEATTEPSEIIENLTKAEPCNDLCNDILHSKALKRFHASRDFEKSCFEDRCDVKYPFEGSLIHRLFPWFCKHFKKDNKKSENKEPTDNQEPERISSNPEISNDSDSDEGIGEIPIPIHEFLLADPLKIQKQGVTLFSKPTKIYIFHRFKDWKLQGDGCLEIYRDIDTNEHYLIFNKDNELTVYTKICFNMHVDYLVDSKTDCHWVHSNHAKSRKGRIEHLACRFKEPEEATQFLEIIRQCVVPKCSKLWHKIV